jgi:hypothetical protein
MMNTRKELDEIIKNIKGEELFLYNSYASREYGKRLAGPAHSDLLRQAITTGLSIEIDRLNYEIKRELFFYTESLNGEHDAQG